MKMRMIWVVVGVACLGLLGGCGKSSKKGSIAKPPPVEIKGVQVDAPELQFVFMKASPAASRKANEAWVMGVKMENYPVALAKLDEVLKMPDLTSEQKELATRVSEQLKQVMAKGQ